MADKTIGELPSVASVQDNSLIPVEQNSVASKMTGAQFKQWAIANAQASANLAAQWATGGTSGTPSATNNAKYYAETAAAWSAHPPYIGANGNWYVWNTTTEQYEDSHVDASITVQIADITMLATDATPYVTNSGTDTDPVFHLYIPRGATGLTGATGNGIASAVVSADGELIITYTNGATVNLGSVKGPQGATGDTGATGPQGPQGIQGPQGPQGISGVAVAADGTYAFNVDANGHLILSYTGADAPNFSIDSTTGHLILTL